MAVGGDLSPLSGLMCEIVNSVGQGNFRNLRLWPACLKVTRPSFF